MAEFSLQGMFNWAVEWCNKPNVGYWMEAAYRNMRTYQGITYFDCSSFVFFAMWLGGGLDVGRYGFPTDLEGYQTKQGKDGYNAWVVHTMTPLLPSIGFQRIYPVPDYWLPGDILTKYNPVDRSGHTEICYASPRRTMGAHTSKYALPDQVSINTGNTASSYYQYLWRYTGSDAPIPPAPPEPDPGGDPGVDTENKRMKVWMMCKPWWKI